mgnify:CR=1 FL=1
MKVIKLNIELLNNSNGKPEYGSDEASGIDLKAGIESDILIKPKDFFTIPTGIIIEIPKGYEAQIRPRSGLAAKYGITVLNSPGTIDSDYRGEIKVILFNHGPKEFIINNKDRIAQMILAPILKVDFEETDDLPETIRGSGGFGSTGK